MTTALYWLLLNFLSVVVLAFYSMTEMACVSFNRVRLHYYVSKKDRRALMLNELLHNPSKLFGTTLIGVSVAMFFGSECAREFHEAIGVSPDLAPLSQVFLVVILGELAPMFAARGYAEHVAMLGIPILYASTKVMAPFLYILEFVTRIFSKNKGAAQAQIYLTQEELQKILEDQEEDQPYSSDKNQFNEITSNIFNLRKKTARQIMQPLSRTVTVSSNSSIDHARAVFSASEISYLPIYHQRLSNIVGIAFPRDLIRSPEQRKVRDDARAPWFVTETTPLTRLLKQFRSNNQEAAIILNQQGNAIGVVTLEDVVEEILGKGGNLIGKKSGVKKRVVIDRTFPGTLLVSDFNSQFGVLLDHEGDLTLEELIVKKMGYHPEVGESIYIEPFELMVKETTLRGIKSVTITSKIE
ncbi:MAG: HlyC/CorC family transporter [Parachlamydiaceae bacterium]|nr:HlyC/CorC family transporter [Parachlamydiaceae bacterium]